MLGLGPHRGLLRDRVQRRLCLAHSHAARTRHPCRLRSAEERDRETARPRPADARERHRRGGNVREPRMRSSVRLGEKIFESEPFFIGILKLQKTRSYSERFSSNINLE